MVLLFVIINWDCTTVTNIGINFQCEMSICFEELTKWH